MTRLGSGIDQISSSFAHVHKKGTDIKYDVCLVYCLVIIIRQKEKHLSG